MNYVLSPAAVAKLRRLLGGVLGNALTPSASPATVSPDDFPAPYTVHWSQSENSGAGAWCIWLPGGDLSYNKTDISASASLSAATALPSGWYVLSGIATTGAADIYLNLTNLDSTPAAAFSSTATSATGSMAILVATVSRTSATGAVAVKQRVVGSLHLGGGASASASGIVVMSVDYVTSSGDDDFAAHPYAIRIRRGNLTNVNGVIQPVEDATLKQFIDTIEHSAAMDQT